MWSSLVFRHSLSMWTKVRPPLIAPLWLIGSATPTGGAQNASDSPKAAAAEHGGMMAQAASIRPMQVTSPTVFSWRVIRQQSGGDEDEGSSPFDPPFDHIADLLHRASVLARSIWNANPYD